VEVLTAEPKDVGLDRDRLARVDHVTHRYVDDGKLPGVMTVIARRGEVVHHDRYGWADVESRRALRDDDIFRIYSMTKPITSVALMMLYEEGEVLLENPVSRYIPTFADTQVWESGDPEAYTTAPPERAMTVHDVLTHMSGLTAGFQFQHPVDALYRANGLGDLTRPEMSLADGIDVLATMPLLFTPGSRWEYGASTDVVGRIVEVVSGQTLDRFFRDRILDPLGMVDTEFWVEPDDHHRLVSNYVRGRDRSLRRIDEGGPASAYAQRPAYLSGAGGLVSTAADYQRFLSMLAGGGEVDGVRILGPRTLALMTSNQLPGGVTLNEMGQSTFSEAAMEGTGFGLGFSVVIDPAASHSLTSTGEFGWGGAASTAFWVDPAEELTVQFLTQLVPSNMYPIRRQLRATVYQAIVD
jgi:CubicO group peptidase (beta-lactamase class C family)